MNTTLPSYPGLMRLVTLRFVGALLFLLAVLFLPAGTWDYWQAWVYIVILLLPAAVMLFYLMRNDPALLERRMRTHEREPQQRLIIRLSFIWFFLIYIIPGLDKRFAWSNVPVLVVIAADVLVVLGYIFVCFVLRENSFASRIVEVEKEQRLISSGPYSLVRHPMYTGIMLMYVFSPLALGSFWAMIPTPMIIVILVLRIQNEETLLLRELKGYAEYMQNVRYRLVPGIW